jgi:hypothetical protein
VASGKNMSNQSPTRAFLNLEKNGKPLLSSTKQQLFPRPIRSDCALTLKVPNLAIKIQVDLSM